MPHPPWSAPDADPGVESRTAEPPFIGQRNAGLPDRDRALRLYRERRQRDRVFRGAGVVMAEPSWDILLLLYGLEGAYRPLSQADVVDACGVAEELVLRHLRILTHAGLIRRSDGATDRTPAEMTLTDHGITLMRLTFDTDESSSVHDLAGSAPTSGASQG